MTFAPLFSWSILLRAILTPQHCSFDDVASRWLRKNEKYIWLSRSMWSMACIVKLRKIIGARKQPIVWVPDFFCNSSLSIMRQEGARIIFYPLNEDLSPNIEVCEEIAKNNEDVPDIVISAHYFGNVVDIKGIARLCKKYHAWLVEDAAHVLAPISGVGEIGDFVCYSPHKHLPIPDGAILIMRAQGISKLRLDESNFGSLNSIVLELPNAFLCQFRAITLWLVKRVAQKIGIRRNKLRDNFYLDGEVATGIQYPHMSLLSKKIIALYAESLDEVASNRRQVMRSLDILFSLSIFKDKFLRLNYESETTSPYLLPFQILDSRGGNHLFNTLQKLGLPVSSWPDLPPEVLNAPSEYCKAIAKRKNYFYVSPHQSISNCELNLLFNKVASIDGSGWFMRELNKEQWKKYFISSTNPSLLQTWEFGNAKQSVGYFKARRFLVQSNEGEPVAIAQFMILKIPFIGSFAYLNQGPIFLPAYTKCDHKYLICANTIKTLFSQARKFGFQLLYISPTSRVSGEEKFFLKLLGLRKLYMRTSWGSAILRLDKTSDELMSALTRSWRGHLRKSQQLGIEIQSHISTKKNIDYLINQYKVLQNNKKFNGISEKLIRALALQNKENSGWRFNLFTAHESKKLNLEDSIGLLVTIEFHDTAIYLIGITSKDGRSSQANYALLWFAILHAKKNGIIYFDLGGVSEDTPKGISDFKYGTGAQPFRLIGEWRPSIFGI